MVAVLRGGIKVKNFLRSHLTILKGIFAEWAKDHSRFSLSLALRSAYDWQMANAGIKT
jgi:hypothetical protein